MFEIRDNTVFCHITDKTIVLSPAVGLVSFIGELEGKTAIVISNYACDYVLMGMNNLLVTVGEIIRHKDPVGIYEASTNDDLLQLRLYKNDVQLDPKPYQIDDQA